MVKLNMIKTAVVVAAFAVAAASPACAEMKPKQLTIFTSVSGSSWYGIGAGMAEIFARQGVQSNPELGAALSNIANVAANKGELGFSMSPAITVAKNGEKPFGAPVTNVAVIAALSESLMHIIVDGEEGFETVGDLKGHPFVTQNPGSITAVVFTEVLKAYGLGESDLSLSKGSLTEQRDALKDRRSEGIVSIASFPSSCGAELASTIPIDRLPISDEAFSALKSRMPTAGRSMIPANSYKGQTKDVPTVSAMMILVAPADMSNDEAYWMAKTLAEQLESVRGLHASYAKLTVAQMADVPGDGLHPGAEKYFREVGALQ